MCPKRKNTQSFSLWNGEMRWRWRLDAGVTSLCTERECSATCDLRQVHSGGGRRLRLRPRVEYAEEYNIHRIDDVIEKILLHIHENSNDSITKQGNYDYNWTPHMYYVYYIHPTLSAIRNQMPRFKSLLPFVLLPFLLDSWAWGFYFTPSNSQYEFFSCPGSRIKSGGFTFDFEMQVSSS